MKQLPWIIIVVITIAGAFYWYSYRPSQIKSYCSKFAYDKAEKRAGVGAVEKSYSFYDNNYKACLRDKGL